MRGVCAPARQRSRGLRRAGWKPALPGRAGARLPQRQPRRRRGPGARASSPHVCARRVVGAYARRLRPPGVVRGACDVRAGSPRSRAALARGFSKTPTPPKAGPGSAAFQAARLRQARRRRVCAAVCALPGNVRGACDVRAGSPRSQAALARGCRNANPAEAGPGSAAFQPARLRQARRRRVCAAVCAPPGNVRGACDVRAGSPRSRAALARGCRNANPAAGGARDRGLPGRTFAPGAAAACVRCVCAPPGNVRAGCDVRSSRPHVCARRVVGAYARRFAPFPAPFAGLATCGLEARAPGPRLRRD